jgi:ribosomal protein S8
MSLKRVMSSAGMLAIVTTHNGVVNIANSARNRNSNCNSGAIFEFVA